MVTSKRAPNLVPGVIGDLDLCHAVVLVWPLIAFGGKSVSDLAWPSPRTPDQYVVRGTF